MNPFSERLTDSSLALVGNPLGFSHTGRKVGGYTSFKLEGSSLDLLNWRVIDQNASRDVDGMRNHHWCYSSRRFNNFLSSLFEKKDQNASFNLL